MENELAPILIMASNRGITEIRGTHYKGAHGIPLDLLDRLLIVPTTPYSLDEIGYIIEQRCIEEDVKLAPDAKRALMKVAKETSIRYAIHQVSTAALVASRRKAPEVQMEDIKRVFKLFVDVKRSAKYLDDYQKEFLFDERFTAESGSHSQARTDAMVTE